MKQAITHTKDEPILTAPTAFLDFLRASGYQVEQSVWDTSDLPAVARQLIAQIELVSHHQDESGVFQIFLIQLNRRFPNSTRFARSDLIALLDPFLLRYPQGDYLFAFFYADYPSHFVLGVNQRLLGSSTETRFSHRFWRIDTDKLDPLDWQLLLEISQLPQEQYATKMAKKCLRVFNEAHLRRRRLYRKLGAHSELFWLYLREIGNEPLLSKDEERDLALAARAGNSLAKERLIRANLRLAVHEARRYSWLGIDVMDLIQEGNIGLLQAVDRFDPAPGYRFSTYATWWIRQTLRRAVSARYLIRLPKHMQKQVECLIRSEQQLKNWLCRTPSDEEIALKMGLLSKEETVLAWLGLIHGRKWLSPELKSRLTRATHYVQRLRGIVQGIIPLQLEMPAEISNTYRFENEEDEAQLTLGEVIQDSCQPQLLDQFEARLWRGREIRAILSEILTLRECRIIMLRFGLHDGRFYTLEEIGQMLGLTRERVRQLETKALRKLQYAPIFRQKANQDWDTAPRNTSLGQTEATVEATPKKTLSQEVLLHHQRIWKKAVKVWKRLTPAERKQYIIQTLGATPGTALTATACSDRLRTLTYEFTEPRYLGGLSYRQPRDMHTLIETLKG